MAWSFASFCHIFSKTTAYKTCRCSNQILQRHLFIVLNPLAIEDRGNRREVSKDKIVLVYVPAERASVSLYCVILDEKLPEAVSEFDEAIWGSLVEYVTVGKDKTMVFTLIGGTEMRG